VSCSSGKDREHQRSRATQKGLVRSTSEETLKEVNLAYVPEAQIGDYVIVHVGFAISRIDEEGAKEVFQYLKEMQQ